MTREEQAQGPCRAFQALGVASPAHGWCKAKRRFVPAAECGQGCHLYEDPECPIFCDRGAMIRQRGIMQEYWEVLDRRIGRFIGEETL